MICIEIKCGERKQILFIQEFLRYKDVHQSKRTWENILFHLSKAKDSLISKT